MEMAGRSESVNRDRLSAAAILAGYLDLGDQTDCRQTTRALVSILQSGPGTFLAWSQRGQEFAFSPNFKAAYNATRKLQIGLEYYGDMGDVTDFDPLHAQQQQIVPAIDYDFGPDWEFNFGVGVGVTRSTDHLLIKAILGRRFQFLTPNAANISRVFLH
jgi:hypothetical protein